MSRTTFWILFICGFLLWVKISMNMKPTTPDISFYQGTTFIDAVNVPLPEGGTLADKLAPKDKQHVIWVVCDKTTTFTPKNSKEITTFFPLKLYCFTPKDNPGDQGIVGIFLTDGYGGVYQFPVSLLYSGGGEKDEWVVFFSGQNNSGFPPIVYRVRRGSNSANGRLA